MTQSFDAFIADLHKSLPKEQQQTIAEADRIRQASLAKHISGHEKTTVNLEQVVKWIAYSERNSHVARMFNHRRVCNALDEIRARLSELEDRQGPNRKIAHRDFDAAAADLNHALDTLEGINP